MKTIPFAATLACVLVTIRCAKVFAEATPRVFTILALFAFGWTFLLPYYGPPNLTTELLAAWAGFVDVYVGLMLRREAEVLQGRPQDETVHWIDGGALWLLALIAVPSVPVANLLFYVDREDATKWIGLALTLLAFGSVTYGVSRLYQGSKAWVWLLGVVLFYAGLEIAYDLKNPANAEMSDPFRFLFAVIKCVYTGTFLFLVLRKTTPAADRGSLWHLVLRFFGVVGKVPARV